MTFRYSDYLNSDRISTIANDYGFSAPLNLEKFIMDFELQYQISQRLNCVLRGGMCIPFHIGAKRLSIDVDLMTDQPKKAITSVMNDISSEFPDLIITPINPVNPLPVGNLVSYNVVFQSCFGLTTGIKIDFIFNMNLNFPTTTSQTVNVFSIPINHPITLLSKGALIGDKISALASTSIGISPNTSHIPKQIFDIAGLLHSVDYETIPDMLTSFKNITNQKIENFTSTPVPTIHEIISDVGSSLSSLLTRDFSLTSKYNSIYGSFTSTLLDKNIDHSKLQHIEDILLTRLLSKLIPSDPHSQNHITSIQNTLNEFQRIKQTDVTKISHERQILLDTFPSNINLNKNNLKTIPLSHVFLAMEYENFD